MTTLLTGGGTRSRQALDDDVDLARDRVLVTRAQAGDRAAFDDLYVRYYRRLYRFCLRRLHDSYEAEDIAQEAFSRAWRALPTFAGDRRFYPWLSVIAAHLCTDVLRRRNRSTPVAEFHQGNVASSEDSGEDLMIAAVDSDLVARAFKRLSDRHQRILNLREGSGWSYQKIADHEGVGITAVETLLWRARQALKREFAALAGAEGRTAAWVGGALSLGALRRFLHLPMHQARRFVHLAQSGASVAVGSAAAATAMVVAATFSGPMTQAPGQVPAPSGLTEAGGAGSVSAASVTPGARALLGAGGGSGAISTPGGAASSPAGSNPISGAAGGLSDSLSGSSPGVWPPNWGAAGDPGNTGVPTNNAVGAVGSIVSGTVQSTTSGASGSLGSDSANAASTAPSAGSPATDETPAAGSPTTSAASACTSTSVPGGLLGGVASGLTGTPTCSS